MKELKNEFDGTGEVKGYHFKQIEKTEQYYIYEVSNMDNPNRKHYEVFKRIYNKRFNCESYPKSPSFGKTAWTANNFEHAQDIAKRKFAPQTEKSKI